LSVALTQARAAAAFGTRSLNYARPAAGERPVLTIGVLADTHVPDRMNELHPNIVRLFSEAGVGHILHAGDVCSPAVLEALRSIAPVSAVRGNRDWLLPGLPLAQTVELGGVQVGLMHGHGNFGRYLWDKLAFIFRGYSLTRYLNLLINTLPAAQVVVYGHTHHPELLWHHGKLLFNPGSASLGYLRHRPPTVGLLHIYPQARVSAQFVMLEGYRAFKRKWRSAPVYSPIFPSAHSH
jgi:hypothetical protein